MPVLTLEYLIFKYVPHLVSLDVVRLGERAYAANVKLKWYSVLTCGILRDRTERRIENLWNRLHDAGTTLEIRFL